VNPWILQSRWPLGGVPLWDRAATDRHARLRRGAGLAVGGHGRDPGVLGSRADSGAV